MLVLSRKQGESIHIGESVVVTLVDIRGDKVRIGIDAPKDMNIVRTELKEKDCEPAEPNNQHITNDSSADSALRDARHREKHLGSPGTESCVPAD